MRWCISNTSQFTEASHIHSLSYLVLQPLGWRESEDGEAETQRAIMGL